VRSTAAPAAPIPPSPPLFAQRPSLTTGYPRGRSVPGGGMRTPGIRRSVSGPERPPQPADFCPRSTNSGRPAGIGPSLTLPVIGAYRPV
jgi:hypothetical protein